MASHYLNQFTLTTVQQHFEGFYLCNFCWSLLQSLHEIGLKQHICGILCCYKHSIRLAWRFKIQIFIKDSFLQLCVQGGVAIVATNRMAPGGGVTYFGHLMWFINDFLSQCLYRRYCTVKCKTMWGRDSDSDSQEFTFLNSRYYIPGHFLTFYASINTDEFCDIIVLYCLWYKWIHPSRYMYMW